METRWSANSVSLVDLCSNSQLQLTDEAEFVEEWFQPLQQISSDERKCLDKIKLGYLHSANCLNVFPQMLEMVVVGPLLVLADYFSQPFCIHESSHSPSNSFTQRYFNLWQLKENVWLMMVKPQGQEFSIEVGLSQLIAYLMFTPRTNYPCYGVLTTGSEFIFAKLERGQVNRYATSDKLTMGKHDNCDFYHVFQILKSLRQK
jgi:hypothetical protein